MIDSMEKVSEVLKKARTTYGAKNQLSVATEELCELSAVLQKFIRYSTPEKAIEKTRDEVIGELADVYNVIDHIIAIYGITPEELEKSRMQKAERLRIWLEKGNDLEYTTEYRDIRS